MTGTYSGQDYNLKRLSYLLLPISVYVYFTFNNLTVFTPNVLIAALDFSYGGRTTALIVLVPIFASMIVRKARIPWVLIITFAVLFVVVESLRVSSGGMFVKSGVFANIGELRETFLGTPILLETELGSSNSMHLGNLLDPLYGFSGPFRSIFETPSAGEYIQNEASRGYGLGSNFVAYSLFYFKSSFLGTYLLQIVAIVFAYLSLFIFRDRATIAIQLALWIIFIRLGLREGFLVYFGLYYYLLLITILIRFFVLGRRTVNPDIP